MVGLGQWILALSPLMRCAEVKGIEGNHYLITSTVTHTRTQAGNRPCDCTAKRRSVGGDTRTHTPVLRRATAHAETFAGRYTHTHMLWRATAHAASCRQSTAHRHIFRFTHMHTHAFSG